MVRLIACNQVVIVLIVCKSLLHRIGVLLTCWIFCIYDILILQVFLLCRMEIADF